MCAVDYVSSQIIRIQPDQKTECRNAQFTETGSACDEAHSSYVFDLAHASRQDPMTFECSQVLKLARSKVIMDFDNIVADRKACDCSSGLADQKAHFRNVGRPITLTQHPLACCFARSRINHGALGIMELLNHGQLFRAWSNMRVIACPEPYSLDSTWHVAMDCLRVAGDTSSQLDQAGAEQAATHAGSELARHGRTH